MNKALVLSHRHSVVLAAAMAVGALAPAQAGGGHHHADTAHLGVCLEAAEAIKPGDFVKVEYLTVTHEGDPSFEIEVRDANGTEWEFMCEANDGSIYELEQEAGSANDARFKKNVKVSEQQARKTATDLYVGTIEEVEYEIEGNGDSTYEIDVVDKEGTEFKVEVDAASGDIIEVHVEEWEIGEESDERAENKQ